MSDEFEIEDKMSVEEIEKLLPTNKYTFSVQVQRIMKLLKKIKPKVGNFLFWYIIGRIVWNASATANSIGKLIEIDDHYGATSLTRKLFECKLMIDYLFQANDRSKIIGRIMSYELFTGKGKTEKEEAINIVTAIVNGFGEDQNIIKHFEYYLERGPKHWNWTEKSFEKLARSVERKTGDDKIDNMLVQSKIELLNLYHRGAHVDLDLSNDYLLDKEDGDIEYKSPLEESKEKLFGIIGLSRLIIMDIIDTIELKLKEEFTT